MENKLRNAIQRVRTIGFANNPNEASAFDVVLAREYLRRVALMAISTSGWTGGPFFDAAKVVAADLDTQVKLEIEAAVSEVALPNAYVRKLCVDYIKWHAYRDAGHPLACSYADVYEPLLMLFERGQSIGFHHGELIVGSYAIPLKGWLELANIPPADLNSIHTAAEGQ